PQGDKSEGVDPRTSPEHPQRVAQVLPQLIEPDGNPDGTRRFFRQCHVAERPPRRGVGSVRRHAAGDVVLGLTIDVIADVLAELVEAVAPRPPDHAGRRTRAIARARRSHFDVSIASCFRPFGVSRYYLARRLFFDVAA